MTGLDPQNLKSPSELPETRAEITRLRTRIQELETANHLAQTFIAESMLDKNQLNPALAAAVQELYKRLKMLLSSRLLHLGWKIGLGKTPYWNDPAADELTNLIEVTRAAVSGNSQSILNRINSALSASPDHLAESGAMDAALAHLHQKGFRPDVILDIGAAKGWWTVSAAQRWHGAEFFMIDPLLESEPFLQQLCRDPRFHYLRLAIGDKPGQTTLYVGADPDGTSLLIPCADSSNAQSVPIMTIDQLLESATIKPPQLVKIDVQGYELKVLQGAAKIFEHAEVFIIEANLFEFMPGCPRLHELIAFMADRGFYPFDFAGFLRRPYQNDLGQIDVVFINQSSPLVSSNRWLDDSVVHTDQISPAGMESSLVISVIICTRNPQPAILHRTLNAIDNQTLEKDRFELIVIDNGSRLRLEHSRLQENLSVGIKLVTEPVPGLGRARTTGISHSRGELLVFVDDDNFLDPDYLRNALAIARREPGVGLFGGICEAELEAPIPNWKKSVLPHLGVRNHGDKPITKFADHWGVWEPIGAGMIARKRVAGRFVKMMDETPAARLLGRSGSSMLSGEDSLFARAAYREGYACSYQPALRLTHFIKSSRLTASYMAKVVEGHGRSFVILQRALGKPVPLLKMRTALARVMYRLKGTGRAGLITGRWEIGYARECESPSKELPVVIPSLISLPPATMAISVILCTRNPRPDLLTRTLDSLEHQQIDRFEFEVIVVDNGSRPSIQLTNISAGRSMQISVIREEQPGHIFARSAGILAARGHLIVFVDDDNFLAPDYLANAIRIGHDLPTLGTFGGIAEPEFETPPAPWKLPLLRYLAVRNHGPSPITSKQDFWGEWEPIGAGLVVRRDVAERFVQWVRDLPGVNQLGRSDQHLMSGDDSLFSRAAHRMGYANSYQPALKLTHHIKKERFHLSYLARLLNGHGRTYVLLNQIMEKPNPKIGLWQTLSLIGYRFRREGRVGLLQWCWDLGRHQQIRGRGPFSAD